MNLLVLLLEAQGSADDECLILTATGDCDLGDFAVIDRTYRNDGAGSDLLRHFFWFPSLQLKDGDYVRLHSGHGFRKSERNEEGSMTHSIYWNLESPVWNDSGDRATLIQIAGVEEFVPSNLSEDP